MRTFSLSEKLSLAKMFLALAAYDLSFTGTNTLYITAGESC